MPSVRNILIVDDNDSVRSALRSLIEATAGLRVCGEAADGLRAIEKTRELQPDLILLDLAMPKLNGAATASILKHLIPRIPIILFTLYETAADKLGLAVGADLVLSKPDGLHDLVDKIQDLLEGRSPRNHAAPA
jgi:DNA-binding NarL/FixJ family response regulator